MICAPSWGVPPKATTAAAEALLTHLRPLVVRYCRGRLGRAPAADFAADDAAQEVLLAVLNALPRYRDEGRPFEAFVFGIAAHKVADVQRAAFRTAIPTDVMPDATDLDMTPEERVVQAGDIQLAQLSAGPAPREPPRAPPAAGRGRAVG